MVRMWGRPDMRAFHTALVITSLLTSLFGALVRPAAAAGIFDGDPIDPSTSQAYPILPGVPLITPQADGRYRPPIVNTGQVGDVDLVVRAATVGIGPLMPPPQAIAPVAVAGGTRVTNGGVIPFTVIASTGGAGVGAPLGGSSMDLIPVIVLAWADLDDDGMIGPTDSDPDGASDNNREHQEALYPVGVQIAVFAGGIAQGEVAVWKGAPASSGGLAVVLTAVAYVGPFLLPPPAGAGDAFPFVPDGPPVATMLPFFPRFDVTRVIDGNGMSAANPSERLKIELSPEFDIPVNDPDLPALGNSFAIPTNGSSLTVDRAASVGGAVSRLRFVQPSIAAAVPVDTAVDLYPGAGGALFEALAQVSLPDNGPGAGAHIRLVPVDLLDNITDPTPSFTATLVAGPGLGITVPNTDGDPSRETITVNSAAGIEITLDDLGGLNDSGTTSRLSVASAGFPTDTIAVQITPGTGGGSAPVVRDAEIVRRPVVLERTCPSMQTIAAVIDSAQAVTATATLQVGNTPIISVPLLAGATPPGSSLPPGQVYRGQFDSAVLPLGQLTITIAASNASGAATPFGWTTPVVENDPPAISNITITPTTIPVNVRTQLQVTARIVDGCGTRRVTANARLSPTFRRIAGMLDKGRRGDAVAGDLIYTGQPKLRVKTPGTYEIQIQARDRQKATAVSPSLTVTVE
jgi:hypothetical protein